MLCNLLKQENMLYGNVKIDSKVKSQYAIGKCIHRFLFMKSCNYVSTFPRYLHLTILWCYCDFEAQSQDLN